jgi:cell division protease FtsH
VDCAVRDLVTQAFDRAVAILEAHRDALADSAERLLEKETLRGDELPMLIAEPGVPTPAGARATREAPNEPAESHREAADQRDIERAEDEGMTVRRR